VFLSELYERCVDFMVENDTVVDRQEKCVLWIMQNTHFLSVNSAYICNREFVDESLSFPA
jgi:hypothetical protein